eukprot:gene15481-18331_t
MKPGWEKDPGEDPMPEGKYGSWTPASEKPEKINFTKFLTLFHHYPDLMHLTTADGQRAIPMATLGKTKPNTITSETWAKIEPGNRETIVKQYRTIWNTNEETWSTAETIIQYMRNAGKGEQESEQELKALMEMNEE